VHTLVAGFTDLTDVALEATAFLAALGFLTDAVFLAAAAGFLEAAAALDCTDMIKKQEE
jgi:hypothetical protein